MTTLIDNLTAAVDIARQVKVKTAERGQENINTTIICHRGDIPVAMIEMDRMDRDTMLLLADTAGTGYEADMLTLAFETFLAVGNGINPRTGEHWGPGEMQDCVEHYEGRENGWIRDALMVYVVNRAGDQIARTMPYRLRGRRVEWIENEAVSNEGDDSAEFSGYVPRKLAAAMNRPGLTATATTLGHDLSDMTAGMSIEAITAHQDCAVTRVLIDPPPIALMRGMPMGTSVALYSEPGTERDRIIKRSLPSGKRMRPPSGKRMRPPS